MKHYVLKRFTWTVHTLGEVVQSGIMARMYCIFKFVIQITFTFTHINKTLNTQVLSLVAERVFVYVCMRERVLSL